MGTYVYWDTLYKEADACVQSCVLPKIADQNILRMDTDSSRY